MAVVQHHTTLIAFYVILHATVCMRRHVLAMQGNVLLNPNAERCASMYAFAMQGEGFIEFEC